jgi:hypothetical protein
MLMTVAAVVAGSFVIVFDSIFLVQSSKERYHNHQDAKSSGISGIVGVFKIRFFPVFLYIPVKRGFHVLVKTIKTVLGRH